MESFEKNTTHESLPDRERVKKLFAEKLDQEGWVSTPNGEDYCGNCWKKHPHTIGDMVVQPLSELLDYRDNGSGFSVECGRGDCTNKDNLLFSEEYTGDVIKPIE